MTSNKQQDLNTDGNSDPSSNLTGTDQNESALKDTGKAMSACDFSQFIRTEDMLLLLGIASNEELCKFCNELEIRPTMSKHLLKLQYFRIAIVCDDSGSMLTPVIGAQGTRWNELCSFVKTILKIGVIFDSNGIDIYFLNREPILKVKDPKVVDQVFAVPPCGHTPLVPALDKIFESQLVHQEYDNRKLLVFVATDGEPTDKVGNPNVPELERLMQEKRKIDTTYVSFLLCTDDPVCVNYLHKWDRDRTMPNIDVTDNFLREREKIREHRGHDYHFSYADYVVRVLVGAIVPEIRCSQ